MTPGQQCTPQGPCGHSLCEIMHQELLIAKYTVRASPGGSVIKNLPTNVGAAGSIPGSGRSPGEGNGNPLQYSCLENPMDRGVWQAMVHGVAKN